LKPYGKGEPQTRTHRDSRPKRVGQDHDYLEDSQARRMTDGRPFKRYTDDIPEWALTILNF
jgi:hypothetical protein